MLDAAGTIVHVGAEYLACAAVNITDATALLADMLAQPEPASCRFGNAAIRRLLWVMMGSAGIFAIPYALLFGEKALLAIILSPILLLQFRVNP